MKHDAFAALCLTVLTFATSAHAVEPPGEMFAARADGTAWPISMSDSRHTVSLNGTWQIIVDPFEAGRLDYQSHDRQDGYGSLRTRTGPEDRVEHSWDDAHTLEVPGDWNSQKAELFFYEGTVWYRRTFARPKDAGGRWFLRFDGANRQTFVYFNGKALGKNSVGFTPFEFEVTSMMRDGENVVAAAVNNTREAGAVPAFLYDWWNYGGLTRDVSLVHVPETFVRTLNAELSRDRRSLRIRAVMDGGGRQPAANAAQGLGPVELSIPELGLASGPLTADSQGVVDWSIPAPESLQLWSPETPKLYEVSAKIGDEQMRDRFGFRTIEARDGDIHLNGIPVYLRGICIHEEAPDREGRAHSRADALGLLRRAKELGCNYVRLAHYPHNEHMLRAADELGLMVWAEIPVYWTLEYESPATLAEASEHLTRMIARDRGRASVIIWSIGNETGDAPERTAFRLKLGEVVKSMDPTRLLSAALFAKQIRQDGKLVRLVVDDPFGALADVLAINEYVGWYHDQPEDILGVDVELKWNKPFLISETGADVKRGLRGDTHEVWTEDFGARYYTAQLTWVESVPELDGISPWILKDFRSPRRPLYGVQDWYNRKGLLDEFGKPKLVFDVVREYYLRWAKTKPSPSSEHAR